MTHTSAHLIVTGFVQGVGFRQFVKKQALQRGLTGWVKNRQDGTVETRISGKKETIEDMIAVIKKGTVFSNVKEVSVAWENDDSMYDSFEITFD